MSSVTRITRVATITIGLVLTGCGGPDTQDVVRSWLLCDDCLDRELLKLRDEGDEAVPELAEALRDGPSPDQISNVRAQSRSDVAAVNRVGQKIAVTAVDSADMYGRNVQGYIDTYQERALIGLTEIGTTSARDTILALLKRDSTQAFGWSPSVRAAVLAHALGVYDLSIVPVDPLAIGMSRQAGVRIKGYNQNAVITWTSSNTAVVTVTATGMLTAVTPGQAIIRACWSGPGVEPICAIRTVRVVP